jgi:hypothetical protein
MMFPVQEAMLPIFSLYRSANLTEEAAQRLLGDLKTALAAPRKIMLLSVTLLVAVLTCTCCCAVRDSKKKAVIPSLLESTDNALMESTDNALH